MVKSLSIPLVLAFLVLGVSAFAEEKARSETISGKAVCKMEGCQGGCCIGTLEGAVKAVKGVKLVKIDAKANKMIVETEPGAEVSLQDIRAAIGKADSKHNHGFKLIEVEKSVEPQKPGAETK